jgi:hypothetical protein
MFEEEVGGTCGTEDGVYLNTYASRMYPILVAYERTYC